MSLKVFWAVALLFLASSSGGVKSEGVKATLSQTLVPKQDQFSTTVPQQQHSLPILAPIVDDYSDDEDQEDNQFGSSFAPGTIISGVGQSLNKFRASIFNIIPVFTRPSNPQSDPEGETTPPATTPSTFVTDCTEYSGLQCSDCNTMVVSKE